MSAEDIRRSLSQCFDPERGLYIYGAGELGRLAVEYCESCNIKVIGVLDSHRTDFIEGKSGIKYRILTPKTVPLEHRSHCVIAVAIATSPFTPILDFLVSMGWCNIIPFYSLTGVRRSGHPLCSGWLIGDLSNEERDSVSWIKHNWADIESSVQYDAFLSWHHDYSETVLTNYPIDINKRYIIKPLLDYLSVNNKQCLDIGSHDGGTIRRLSSAGVYFDEYVLVEPDSHSSSLLTPIADNLRSLGCSVVVMNELLGESCTLQPFQEGLGYCSQIWSESIHYRKTVSVDSLHTRPNFIKVHTEGSEHLILKGAQDTIKEYRPALAFSVYHTRDGFCHDIYEAMKMFNGYDWFFRLHSYQGTGAFVYGIPNYLAV